MGLTACEHKDLCYDHPHFATVRVVFDWTKISNHDKPEGMRVVFYPTDDESNTWIFDFPGGEDGEVELPENDYRVICFNYDTDGMVWKENGSYTLFTADTRDVRSPDNQTMAVTPPWLCGDHIDRVILKDIPEGSTKIIRLTPVNMVCHYTYEVNGIRGLDRVADLRAALSGMSGSLNMSADSLPAGLSESLLFDGMVSRNQIIGGFYTFGHSALEGEPNVFRLYLKNRSGSMSVLEQDVSDQVHDVPVAGHIGDVHLVLNFDYEVPSEPGNGGPGFDVDVDDWDDVNGATRNEAIAPFVRQALIKAFSPGIANMAVTGLVALPGTMIGQILGGSSPHVAIKYQIMIVVITVVASMLSLMMTIFLASRKSFDSYGRLLRVHKDTKRK